MNIVEKKNVKINYKNSKQIRVLLVSYGTLLLLVSVAISNVVFMYFKHKNTAWYLCHNNIIIFLLRSYFPNSTSYNNTNIMMCELLGME